jgi:hypothetical protein
MPDPEQNAEKPAGIPAWQLPQKEAEAKLAATKAALEERRLLDTQQLQLLAAQQELIGKILPAGQSKPLEGKIEAGDTFGYISDLVATRALGWLADDILAAIKGIPIQRLAPDARILIIDSLDYSSGDLALLEVKTQLEAFNRLFTDRINENKKLLPKVKGFAVAGAAAALALAPAVLSLAADVVGYFQTDLNVTSRAITLPQQALISAVAGRLAQEGRWVAIENLHTLHNAPIVAELGDVRRTAGQLKTQSEQLSKLAETPAGDIARAKKAIEKLEKEKALLNPQTQANDIKQKEAEIAVQAGILAKAEKTIEPLAAAQAASQALLDEFSVFYKGIITKAEGETHPRLIQAARRSYYLAQPTDGGLGITHLLYLGVLSSGGEAIIKKNFFNKLWGAGNARFLGGVAASYVLAELRGQVVFGQSATALGKLDFNLGGGSVAEVERVR